MNEKNQVKNKLTNENILVNEIDERKHQREKNGERQQISENKNG